jgi:hypothetical protein
MVSKHQATDRKAGESAVQRCRRDELGMGEGYLKEDEVDGIEIDWQRLYDAECERSSRRLEKDQSQGGRSGVTSLGTQETMGLKCALYWAVV